MITVDTLYEYNPSAFATIGPRDASHVDPAIMYAHYLPPPQAPHGLVAYSYPQPSYPYPHPYTNMSFALPSPVYPPTLEAAHGGPTHPFGLGNVLRSIHERTDQTPHTRLSSSRTLDDSRRNGPNITSQSCNGGGVDLQSNESSSTGSSQTMQASEPIAGRRRRRRVRGANRV